MKIYLSAAYDHKETLREYAEQLRQDGHEITSRWLDTPDEANSWWKDDLLDIYSCDLMICFAEPNDSPRHRGGRHVEFGYALLAGVEIFLIGERENDFYNLVNRQYDCWEDCQEFINRLPLATFN